jgi:hypothetical protein
MLIATVPYVGKRLHLDPDPKLNYGSGSEHANNFGSGSTTLVEGKEIRERGIIQLWESSVVGDYRPKYILIVQYR